MSQHIDFERVKPCSGDAARTGNPDTEQLVAQARQYLTSFDWCRDVRACHVGDILVPGVIGVFLFHIEPSQPHVDEWLWVVVGDLPPAYFVTDDAPTPTDALDAYIDRMGEWVDAVKAGKPVNELIPVETSGGAERLETTLEVAKELESRLAFLAREFLEPNSQ